MWLITDQADAENPSILHPAREEDTAASYSTSTSIWMVVQTSVLAPASMANIGYWIITLNKCAWVHLTPCMDDPEKLRRLLLSD